jgi:epidermal growth factor receptor substrate 15
MVRTHTEATTDNNRALADIHNRGALDAAEFTLAMHLIQSLMSQRITSVPASLPAEVIAAASVVSSQPVGIVHGRTPSVSSAGSVRAPSLPPKIQQSPVRTQGTGTSVLPEWDITPHDKAYFDSLFKDIDTSNKGFIGAQFLCMVS